MTSAPRGLRASSLPAALAVVASGLALVAAPASVSAPRGTVAARPTGPLLKGGVVYREVLAGETNAVFAKLRRGGLAKRPYVLEQLRKGTWRTVATKRATTKVGFTLKKLQPGVTTYRISTHGNNGQGMLVRTKKIRVKVNAPRRPASTWKQLVGTDYQGHMCGIQTDDTGWCWGRTYTKYAIDGVTPATTSRAPRRLPGTWRALRLWVDTTCGIRTDGSLWCWGEHLGPARQVPGSWTSIEVEGRSWCGIRADASAACWTLQPQPGEAPIDAPEELPGTWRQLSLTLSNLCGVRTDETGWCRGYNDWGQLGNGTADGQNASIAHPFTQVAGAWTTITSYGGFSCGVKVDASRWCWGSMGGLDPAVTASPTPSTYLDLAGPCGLRPDGTVYCATFDIFSGPASAVVGHSVTGLNAVSTGLCFTEADSSLWCGIPSSWTEDGDSPYRIPGTWHAPAMTSEGNPRGAFGICALASDSTAWCAGDNRSGEAGTNSFVDYYYPRAQQVQ